MKKFISSTLVTFLFTANLHAQVGIGTTNVDSNIILQIESKPQTNNNYVGGVLFPKIALTATNVFSPVTGSQTNGLLVFNTNTQGSGTTAVTPGYYYWNASKSEWAKLGQKKVSDIAVFSNQDTTTDLNDNNDVFTDLFANVRFNNNSTLYERVNSTTLKINEVGYYKIILNLDLASDGGADAFGMEIYVNNQADIVTDNLYIPGRWDSEGGQEDMFPNGRSFTLYIPINVTGYTLRIKAFEVDPATDVYFKNVNSSTISIEKIR